MTNNTDTITPEREAAVAPATVDLTSYRLVHRALTHGAARLAASVAATRPGVDRERLVALERWYRGYERELDLHHRLEDHRFFPALAARVPTMAEHEARLEAEHELIVTAMRRTGRALAAASRPAATVAAHREAVEAVAELTERMDAHIGYEDADILPLFVRHMDAEEYDAIEEAAKRDGSLRTMAFTVPFIMEAADDAERELLLGDAPAVLRWLWVATRGRYRRLVQAAFD